MSGAAAMTWASAASTLPDGAAAAAETAAAIRAELGEGPVDLCLVFLSTPHVGDAHEVVKGLRGALSPTCIAGTSARGTVTRDHEIEQGTMLSVIAARLPGVEVKPFILLSEAWRGAIDDAATFDLHAPGARDAELVLLLGDPFSIDVERVLALFNRFASGVRLVGGMASAASRPGGNAVLLNDWLAADGAVAIALHGALRADVVVSQGCAPIGPPLDVTHVEENVILTLDGQPALERIEQVLREVPESERSRLKHGLYVGRPARGNASGRGDYLIRNLLGADRDRGAIAVGDQIGPREKIRLHVLDAKAALEDLEMLLTPQVVDTRAAAALLFACNGRGKTLHGAPDRDIATLQGALGGNVPIAGMFCAGEIGPVGGRNFQHGHTASIAIVRPK
jgi:small ligand-binding sensory domain FIST